MRRREEEFADSRGENNGEAKLWFKQRLRIANGNAEIRTTETADDGKGDTDYLAVAIEERAAGAARSGLRIVDNLIGQDIADVALRDQRANQFALLQFLNHTGRVSAGNADNVLHRVFTGAGENRAQTGRVTKRNQRLATDGGFPARIELQDRPLQA